jgi:hypothetical protein
MKYCYILLTAIFLLLFGCNRDRPSQPLASTGTLLTNQMDNQMTSGVRERIFLTGRIGINDTSTGCWYLQTDEGFLIEPLFCVSEPFELRPGLRLTLYGYIEPDAPQTCNFGPVFYAEQTQVINIDYDSKP